MPTVVLGGGCFQNVRLLEGAAAALSKHGFQVFIPGNFLRMMVASPPGKPSPGPGCTRHSERSFPMCLAIPGQVSHG
jgi:hypothetical protein